MQGIYRQYVIALEIVVAVCIKQIKYTEYNILENIIMNHLLYLLWATLCSIESISPPEWPESGKGQIPRPYTLN